jgi:hypothetical protein
MAKKSLSVLTELWRSHVWRDARTINVIGARRLARSLRVAAPPARAWLLLQLRLRLPRRCRQLGASAVA